MCGIAGFWSQTPVVLEELATFTDVLAHRGPDGFGYLAADKKRLGLGHRRLAILDPDERSRQPMLSDDGRYSIVFNGEIFNFLEIRNELSAEGYKFRTESDTEVILSAFAKWGPACQDKFNGMWAFAIWDNTTRQLFVSRDRFGIKPLYFLETHRGTAFASEAKAFAALSWHDELADELDGQASQATTGVQTLKGGMCATLSGPARQLKIRRWWQPLDYIDSETVGYPEQVEKFRELFIDACRLRLRSDVPVGTAISGGMDSSSVLAAVNTLGGESVDRRPQDWSRAFTIVAPGTEHDELEYASAACDAVGVQANIIDLFQRVDPDDIDEYLYLTEGMPLTNLPAWYLYRTMREQGIRVSMDGQGADEILAGYSWDALRILRLEGSWLQRPHRTLDLVQTIRELARDSPYNRIGFRTLAIYSSPSARRVAKHLPGIGARIPTLLPKNHDKDTWQMAQTLKPLNAILFRAINSSIQNLLQRYDSLSMSSGLEIRMPFMDWRLVSYALSLPAESILGHGFTKRILRDAMAPCLPAKIRDRKQKLQFQGPIRRLLRRELKPWLNTYPKLCRPVEALVESGTNAQLRHAGLELVREWKAQTYPKLLDDRCSAIRKKHRTAPMAALQQAIEIDE